MEPGSVSGEKVLSSKRRLRRKQCAGKVRYDYWTARAAVARKWKKGIQLRVYPCDFCAGFHIGHLRRATSGKGKV